MVMFIDHDYFDILFVILLELTLLYVCLNQLLSRDSRYLFTVPLVMPDIRLTTQHGLCLVTIMLIIFFNCWV